MPHLDTPTSQLRFGIARCDITPPVGIYHRMWGAATHERATGVHRPLTTTALVLQPLDGPNKQVILALDHCLLWAREMDDLLQALAQATGLAAEQIAVTYSHTHSSGLMGLERATLPGGELIAPYLKELAQRLAGVIQQAHRELTPATITYGWGRCDLAAQRDFWDAESQQFVCGFNPEAAADDAVVVGRVNAATGKLLATLVNYACHPTTLAWQNTLISPDFPGAMREVVEQATGAPCVFLQGASGDLGPREGFVGDPAVADRNGRQLGYAALSALVALPPPATRFVYTGSLVSGATIGTWEHQPLPADILKRKAGWSWDRFTVPLPYRKDLPDREQTLAELEDWKQRERAACQSGDMLAGRDAHAMVERLQRRLTRIQHLPPGPDFPLPVLVGKLGDAIWFFVEGEHYYWLQKTIRAAFPQTPILVTTLLNGSRCAYLPTAESYGKGIYQESIAVLERGCLESLADSIRARMAASD